MTCPPRRVAATNRSNHFPRELFDLRWLVIGDRMGQLKIKKRQREKAIAKLDVNFIGMNAVAQSYYASSVDSMRNRSTEANRSRAMPTNFCNDPATR